MKDFYTWVKYCVDKKAFSPNNTAMSWDAIEQAAMGGEEALVFFHGVWRVTDQMKALKLDGKDAYFKKFTWINAPAGKKGGKPANLSHPIAYAVSAKSKNKELAAYIVALASQPIPNMHHAVTTNHTPINYGEQSMPEVVEKGWALVAATPMLKYASFMPNHPKIGQYNAIIFKGIQGIETGRLTAQAATDFVVGELENELGKDVVIRIRAGAPSSGRSGRRPQSPRRPVATDSACPTLRARNSADSALNFALFLGPALLLLACFFVAPVIVDVVLAFTDMDRTLAVTTLTLDNFQRMLTRDSRLLGSLGITAVFVVSTLGIFNVTFALLLALTTTAVPKGIGAFFRAVWLLPRMSPSVVYALLWLWVVDPNERGLLNQILVHVLGMAPIDLRSNQPLLVIIIANGFIGASLGMIIFTSAIRSIPEHLFHAARVDGAGSLAIVRHIVFPALRWPISYMTIHQSLSLLVSFEYILLITAGGPFYDTTVFSLYAYRRAFENGAVRVWRRALAHPDRDRRDRGTRACGA